MASSGVVRLAILIRCCCTSSFGVVQTQPSDVIGCDVLLVLLEQDATELVAKLRAYHNTSQLQEDKVRSTCVSPFCMCLLLRTRFFLHSHFFVGTSVAVLPDVCTVLSLWLMTSDPGQTRNTLFCFFEFFLTPCSLALI